MNRTIIPIACVLALKSAQMWNNGYVLSHFAFVKPDTLSSGGKEKGAETQTLRQRCC